MTKTDLNIFKLSGLDPQILEIVRQFKKSHFREYYWTDNQLYRYSDMSIENRYYVHGAISFLIEVADFYKIKTELSLHSNISIIQTINGLHLYDELEYERKDYYWGILQNLYKNTTYIQVTLFPTSDIKRILSTHDFKFFGGSIDNNECYTILEKWTKEYNAALKCIAVGESIDLWIDDSAIGSSIFFEECLKICSGFLQNGDSWRDQLADSIKKHGSFTLYDK